MLPQNGRMNSRFSLTNGTEKGTALRLHDTPNDANVATRTGQLGSIVDAVAVLIAARIVQRITISTVGKRTSLVSDGVQQYDRHLGVNAIPLWAGQLVASRSRIHASQKQYLRRVQIADARNSLLIQQRGLDLTTAATQGGAKLVLRNRQGVDAKLGVDLCFDFGGGQQSHRAQPSPVPEQQLV